MPTTDLSSRSVTALLVVANFLTGCGTTPQSDAPKASEEETVYITSTGSMLPRRIRKSDAMKENLVVEGSDSPTLNQLGRKYMLDEQKLMQSGSGPK